MKQFILNFKRYSYLLGQLVKKNIKLRYRRSYLGILWTLIEPLLTMIVLSVVFGSLLGRNSRDAAFDGVCTDRTSFIFLLLVCHKQCHEVHPDKQRHDQKGICSQIYLPAVRDPGKFCNFSDLPGCAAVCNGVLCDDGIL